MTAKLTIAMVLCHIKLSCLFPQKWSQRSYSYLDYGMAPQAHKNSQDIINKKNDLADVQLAAPTPVTLLCSRMSCIPVVPPHQSIANVENVAIN